MEVHRFRRSSWLIISIYVPRNDRGIGVASLLLHKIIMKAKRHRIHTIYLDSVLPKEATLYTRLGFKYSRPLDNEMYLCVANYRNTSRQIFSHKA